MTVLALTAITDLLLASQSFFLAGRLSARPKDRFSSAWYFTGVLTLLGVAALLGGIDHGFFQAANLPRYVIQRSDWIAMGAVTFCLLMTTATQFFQAAAQRIALIVAVVQFVVNTAAILFIESFLLVVVNYAPVMFLLLAMNLAGLRNGKGSPPMIAGILILFAASAVLAARIDTFSPLDHNSLYHLLSMIGVAFLYAGGTQLKTNTVHLKK
jgi:hypothetical protein